MRTHSSHNFNKVPCSRPHTFSRASFRCKTAQGLRALCILYVFVFVSVFMTLHPLQRQEALEESLHFYISPGVPHCQTDLKSVLLVSWHRTENRFYISWLLIIVPNVKFKFNTKEGVPGINFKGHPILTMQCRIWLHFLCSVIDLIGSLGTNKPNTKNRDEPGHFDDIILLYEVLPVPSGEKTVAWCGGNGLSR